jgi:hypothetical protein
MQLSSSTHDGSHALASAQQLVFRHVVHSTVPANTPQLGAPPEPPAPPPPAPAAPAAQAEAQSVATQEFSPASKITFPAGNFGSHMATHFDHPAVQS